MIFYIFHYEKNIKAFTIILLLHKYTLLGVVCNTKKEKHKSIVIKLENRKKLTLHDEKLCHAKVRVLLHGTVPTCSFFYGVNTS